MQICLFCVCSCAEGTKLAIDWEADTAIEESVLCSMETPDLSRFFEALLRSSVVLFCRRTFAAGNTCTTHGSGTGNTLLGPRGVPQTQTQRFATTSCVAHALLACPGFLVSDLYVRHAICTWCRYRPRRETHGTRACVHVQNQNSLDRFRTYWWQLSLYGAAMPEGKWMGDTPRIFLVLQRFPCHLFRRRFIFGDNCDQSSALACTMLQRVH